MIRIATALLFFPVSAQHPQASASGSIFQSSTRAIPSATIPRWYGPNYTTGMLEAERRWKWIAMRDYFAGDFNVDCDRGLGREQLAVQGVRLGGARYPRSAEGCLLPLSEPLGPIDR